MMIVDTSVWADYFNGVKNSCTDRLDRALAEGEDLAILPFIVTEVLQGFRTEAGFLKARDLLLSLPVLVLSIECYVVSVAEAADAAGRRQHWPGSPRAIHRRRLIRRWDKRFGGACFNRNYVEAARLFRRLRRKGITVRGTIDCIIAHACLEHDAELLGPDVAFNRIAENTKLRLWRR